MIAEHIQNKYQNARDRVCHVLYYLFDTDESGLILDNKTENIEFIGTSKSIVTSDPFVSLINSPPNEQKLINLDDIKSAFGDIESKNKRVKQPFKHISLSLREGESLTISEWNQLVSEYVTGLGYSDNHWVAVLHKTQNHHAHVVVSCIENSAPYKKTKDSNDYQRSAKIRDTLEDKYGLSKDNNPFVTGIKGNKVNNSQYKNKIQAVRDSIDKVLTKSGKSTKLSLFIDELAENGVGCFVKLNGFDVEGLSFSLGVDKFKGSSLGVGYSWRELNKRGLSYTHQYELDDVLYSNQRESAVHQLIENAYDPVDIYDDHRDLSLHYLLEPNLEVSEFPEIMNLHRYSVFRLINPVSSAKEFLLSTVQKKLQQLKELKKNLYSIYDFVYRFSTMKIDSIMRYTQISSANLQFLFEQAPSKPPINKLIRCSKNKVCLEKTGLLLVSADDFKNDSPSTRDYSLLNSPASRQSSTHSDMHETVQRSNMSTEANVTILPDYHLGNSSFTSNEDLKATRAVKSYQLNKKRDEYDFTI